MVRIRKEGILVAKDFNRVVDPFHNINYGSLSNEQKYMFKGNMEYPFNVEAVGMSCPDKDYYIYRHSSDYYVVEYVLDGIGYLTIHDKTYTLKAGDVYILPPESKHGYRSDYDAPYSKIWCNLYSDTFTKVRADYHLDKEYVFHAPECRDDFLKLFDIARFGTCVNDDEWTGVAAVLMNVLNKIAANVYRPIGGNVVATKAKEALDNSLFTNITIEELSEELFVSKMTLTKEFKNMYGITPYSYYLNKKLSQAKLMLKSDMTIKEISDKLCFTDEHYFSGLFKQKVGVSPTDFKKITRGMVDN